jgi:uncharacterized membrane protein
MNIIRALAVVLALYAVAPLVIGASAATTLLTPLAEEYVREQIPVLASYAAWDWTHRVGGFALLACGLLQLRGFQSWHRVIGRAYAALASVMSLGGAWMAVTAPFSPAETLPALVFAALLEGCVVLGIAAARAGRIPEHRRWMQRSFAVALGPLLVRMVHIVLATGMSEREAMAPAFWIGWSIPLLVLEGRR